MKKAWEKALAALLVLALAFAATAAAETRTRVTAREGMEEEILETRFESRLGYALWYDAAQFTYYPGGMEEGGDMFVPASGDAVTPVYLSATLKTGISPEDAVAQQESRFAADGLEETSDQVLESGAACRVVAAERAGVFYRVYLFETGEDVLAIETACAAEAEEGFGSRLADLVGSITLLDTAEITLFAPDGNFDRLVGVQTEVYDTPQGILHALKDARALPEDVTVESFSIDGSTATLDLSSNFAEMMAQTGTAGEYLYMGGIVNTFLTRYGLDTITVLSGGQPVETGHAVYDQPQKMFG